MQIFMVKIFMFFFSISRLLAAQQQQTRRRAVLYAVVKAPTYACMAPLPPSGYQANYQQQSNYIVAARVNPSIRATIQDLFWETGFDLRYYFPQYHFNLILRTLFETTN